MIRIKAVTVFIPSSTKFQKGEVADKIRMFAAWLDLLNLDEPLWSL